MENKNIEKLINKILWGKTYFQIMGKILILRSLTIKEQNYIDFIYEEELDKALNGEFKLISEEDLRVIHEKDGVWTLENDKEVEKLRLEIKSLESEKARLRVTAKTTIIINKIKRRITFLTEALNKGVMRKYSLFSDTAEARADEESKRRMVYYILEDGNDQPIFKSFEEFEEKVNSFILNQIITKYYTACFLDQKTIRWVARNPTWRYRWTMGKNDSISLFGKNIPDLTSDQSNLVYWSQVYDNVYGAYERPPQRIIDNDVLLDKWFEDQSRKAEKEALAKHYNLDDKSIPAGKVGKTEMFIMAHSPEEAAEIQSLNDDMTQVKIKKEAKKIQESNKPLTEAELRKDDLILQARQAGLSKGR